MQENAQRKTEAGEAFPPAVRIEDGRAKVRTEDGDLDLPVQALPEKFVEWIEQGRRAMYGKILGQGSPGFFASHLPMVATWNKGASFPFNCSNKGVGFLPKREYLAEYVELFRNTLERTRGRPWQESLRERVEAVSRFYFDREKVDYRALSTLEIFEKGTYRNLSRTPLAAVHYTGNGPDYISFQVNCAVEIIKPDDPRHEFVHLARVMFEYDSFHISQTNFPYAYVLWISEVLDKTPFRVPQDGKVVALPGRGGMAWDPEAMESVNRAPGMIRQFITDSIEKYARERGFDRVTMALAREAREVLERTPARPREPAAETASAAASPSGAAHSAAAPSGAGHETAASAAPVPSAIAPAAPAPSAPAPSAAASTAPAPAATPAPASASGKDSESASRPYASIYVGLDSSKPSDEAMALALDFGKAFEAGMFGSHVYAAKMHDNRFRAMEGGLPEQFQVEKELNRQRKIHDTLITKGLELITDSYLDVMARECAREGLRFTAVSLEGKNWKAMAEDIDAHGHDLVVLGAHGVGRVASSQLGTVAERLLRRVRRDVLLVKTPREKNLSDTIVVCLDGSTRSWGGLQRALQLGKAFGKRVLAVSAFDPYFHYAMFKSLNRTLSDKARKVFKFEEQEKLHEDIIDSGLAKIYQSYLNIAARLAGEQGVAIETRLLDGKPFEKILQLVRKSPPWLLVLGRIGFHSDEDMDIGGNTENLARLAGCNLLVCDAKARPPAEFQAEETVAWTKEARARIERIPSMAQGMAMKAIQNYCIAEGFTVVTESVLNAALKSLLPPEAMQRMGLSEPAPTAAAPAAAAQAAAETHDRIALSFKCQACGHVHHGSRPRQCPICGMGGHMFKLVESAMVEDGQVLATLGDRQLIWEKPALAALEALPDPLAREQIRNRLEKRALTERLTAITLAMVRAEVEQAGGESTPEVPAPESSAAEVPAAEAPVAWECHLCGLVADGGKPARCVACNTGHFTPMTAAERAKVHPAALGALEWAPEARERLERVPVGFMRDMTRRRVEKWSRAAGRSRVDLEVVEGKYGSWAAGSPAAGQGLPWTDEAKARIERVPDFIRPMVMKELERRVKAAGKTQVEAAELDEAMRHWSGSGRFHGHG